MLQNRYDVVIIGAGPAGLIAAIECCRPAKSLLILEKMPKPVLKLRISGKGRCNITNSAKIKEFIAHFGKNGKFLRHAFGKFFNTDLLNYFEDLGICFKLERGGRYFPRNDNALEIVDALLGKVEKLNIPIETHSEVTAITKLPGEEFSLTIRHAAPGPNTPPDRMTLKAGKVLLATGGKSYPKTGSSGGGYSLASRLGHTITPLFPSLVPITTAGDIAGKLKGLSLKNVSASLWCEGRKAAERFGEMVFTDDGVSGPIILSLSRTIVSFLNNKLSVKIVIDLKPALEHQALDQRLLREIGQYGRQELKSLLKRLLPMKFIPVFIETLGIPAETKLKGLRLEDRRRLRLLLKEFTLEVSGCRSFDEAIVTAGGVSINEIDPRTMESKLVKGLYFAGEIIDIDADTGGFNLQAAFSTGWLAGRSM
ncbi:MAG: aminoacetone oxidase family FAD-binding enzyme [Desulfobacterales bacterium CG07_land_8_20_14_0_80_52_14]|nr:MAG: aminoacetone oxidase family FAD-binding enzyme [Desulfobacterales bacterium CG07_land_8_20_14_0_80_52_14]